jgi:uncharacterized membrane protein YqjE
MNDDSREILILTLQTLIIMNAMSCGWRVRRLNNKQIELIKKFDKNEDYDKICNTIFLK